jgi:type 1 fimbria pilin
MRTISKTFSGLSGTTETFGFDLKVQENARQTWEFYATAATIRIKLKSVFTNEDGTEIAGSGSGATSGFDIQTIDLAQNTLTIVNFDMKLGHVRMTYDDDTTGDMSGTLYVKATTAK